MEHAIYWFRRDLRLHDNHALFRAIQSGLKVKCIFIFDTHILSQLPKKDLRVQFIHHRLKEIKKELENIGSNLFVFHGDAVKVWEQLSQNPHLKVVYTNRDYEPYATQRDKTVYEILKSKNIDFKGYKDQVIFDKNEILSQKGEPYTVYTPYKRNWLNTLENKIDTLLNSYPITLNPTDFYTHETASWFSMKDLGLIEVEIPSLPLNLEHIEVQNYDKTRDIPALDATTKIGTALRFGTLSIREAVAFAKRENQVFLEELIWREFFMQILYHFPYVAHRAFRKKYDLIPWRNKEEEFIRWCHGETGFPLVDAGMRQLNATGFMHNRVRMIAASFLVKDLLIDWRWGEVYFAQKLLDYDLASNNGNWQWAAGTGTDAAPYFRIFNPQSQQKKFDPDFTYVKEWVPTYGTAEYPKPMVNHQEARERCLQAYKESIRKFES